MCVCRTCAQGLGPLCVHISAAWCGKVKMWGELWTLGSSPGSASGKWRETEPWSPVVPWRGWWGLVVPVPVPVLTSHFSSNRLLLLFSQKETRQMRVWSRSPWSVPGALWLQPLR